MFRKIQHVSRRSWAPGSTVLWLVGIGLYLAGGAWAEGQLAKTTPVAATTARATPAKTGLAAMPGKRVPQGFRRVSLVPKPRWSISGVWSANGDSLLLVDASRSRILEYNTAGELLREIEVPPDDPAGFSRPSWIRPWPAGGYIVEQEDAGFVLVSSKLEARRVVDLLTATRRTGIRAAAVFHWAPLASGDLVALGDVQMPDETWKTGLLRVSLDPVNVELLSELPNDREILDLYLVGLPFLTAVGDRAYFVDMSQRPPALREMRVGKTGTAEIRTLPVPPSTVRRPLLRPYISEGSLDQLSLVFYELERSSMIAGIYGWEGDLYLLFHQPSRGREPASWSLVRLDLETETLDTPVALPTDAAHITVIPGPTSWAVLEKGRVDGFGQQDIPTLLLIPSSTIRH